MTQYLHEANCYFGFRCGLGTELIMGAGVSQLPLLWQSVRPRGGGSITQNLAKKALLENILTSSD